MENTNLIEQLRVYPIDFDANDIKLANSFWERVNVSYLEKLFDLGFTVEQVHGIVYGIKAIHALKADTEFDYNGIYRQREDYPNKTLQEIISNAEIGVYEAGLKYPQVGYPIITSVFEKYGISLTPTIVKSTRKNVTNDNYKETKLILFTSNKLIIGFEQSEYTQQGNIEALNDGYWGIISSDKDLLTSLLIDLFDHEDSYVKDLDLYYNGLSSVGYEYLKDKNIVTLENGEFKINAMEKESAEKIIVEDISVPSEIEHNTKEFLDLVSKLNPLLEEKAIDASWKRKVQLIAGEMQSRVEKVPSLFPLYVNEMLSVPKGQRAGINPYDKQSWENDSVRNWLEANGKNVLDFMPVREYDLPKYKPFETTHEDNTFMSIHDTFVSKDDMFRIALYGTNFSKDGIISTDANRLLFTPFRGNQYEGEPKIFCHTKKCFEIENELKSPDIKYPDYKRIIPNSFSQKYLLNTFAIYNFLKNVSELGLLSYVGSVGFPFIDKYKEKTTIEFNVNLLLESIASLVKLGHTELEMGINLSNQGVIIYPAKKAVEALKLQEDFVLVMPIKSPHDDYHVSNYDLETNCVKFGESTINYCFDLVATKEKKRLEDAKKLESELAETKNKLAETTSVLTGVLEADKAKTEAEAQRIIEAEKEAERKAEADKLAEELRVENERLRLEEEERVAEEKRIADELEQARVASLTSQDYQNTIDEVSTMLELVDEAEKQNWEAYIDSLKAMLEIKLEEENIAKDLERQKQELILKGQTISYSPDENTSVEELNGTKVVMIKKGKYKGNYVITKSGSVLDEKGEVLDDSTKAFVLSKIVSKNGYHIFVTPKGAGFKPHIWTEGGKFATKEKAEFQANQMRKMKDLYSKVEVIDAEQEETDSEGGGISKINFKLSPETLNLHLGKYGYDDKANRRVKNWNLDDFASYVKDHTTWEGDLTSNPPQLLQEIFVGGKLPFKENEVIPTGANNNFYYNKYPTRGGVMYDIWEQIVKENNITPSDDNEIIKEPTPIWTKQDQKDFDDYEKLYNSLPDETRWDKGSPLTNEMWQRNFELKGKLNLIADKEGKEMKYKQGGGVGEPTELKGYSVSIYKSDYKSSQNVVSNNYDRIVLVTDGKKGDSSTVMSDKPYIKLIKRNIYGKEVLSANPINFGVDNKWVMFGGSFVWSSDSRFREDISERPVPLHDRVENYAEGGWVDEAKTYKINNTTAIEGEVNKYLHNLKLKDGYSNSMGTFTAKLTQEQFNKLVFLIIGYDKNDNVYILNSVNDVVFDSKEARRKRKEMFKALDEHKSEGGYAKGGGVGEIKIGDRVTLPEIKMPNSKVQFEKVENGEVISIENGIYGVLNPKTNRIHQVRLDQIKFAKGGGVGDSGAIYSLSENMSDTEYDEKYSKLSKKQKDKVDILIRLGDTPKLALATILLSKEIDENSDTWNLHRYSKGGGVGELDLSTDKRDNRYMSGSGVFNRIPKIHLVNSDTTTFSHGKETWYDVSINGAIWFGAKVTFNHRDNSYYLSLYEYSDKIHSKMDKHLFHNASDLKDAIAKAIDEETWSAFGMKNSKISIRIPKSEYAEYAEGGEVITCGGKFKVKTSKEDYERTGRQFWQGMKSTTNEYYDLTFDTKQEAENFLKSKYAEGGGVDGEAKNVLSELKPRFEKQIKDFGITEVFFADDEWHITSNYDLDPSLVEAIELEASKFINGGVDKNKVIG